MPEYRYHARHLTGEPIYGMRAASSPEELLRALEAEGFLEVRLLQSSSSSSAATDSLPRLVQLRVGERLREALLLQLPAHEVVRAVADEPFQHPQLMIWPWLMAGSVCCCAAAALLTYMIPMFPSGILSGTLGIATCVLIWGFFLREFALRRPQRVLRRLADELERGQMNFQALQPLLPGRLRHANLTGLPEAAQARLLGELIPAMSRLRQQRYYLLSVLLGTVLPGIALTGGVSLLASVMLPELSDLLKAFGTESNAGTILKVLLQLCIAATMLLLAFFVLAMAMLYSDRWDRVGRRLPLVGRSVIWLSQAGFCRVIAAYLRQSAASSSAIESAALLTGGAAMRSEAAIIATQLQEGHPQPEADGPWLNGLPLGLLSLSSGVASQPSEAENTAATFDGLAAAFESASRGHGSFAAGILGILLVMFGGAMMLTTWLVFISPLIKLLGGLSVFLIPKLLQISAGELIP